MAEPRRKVRLILLSGPKVGEELVVRTEAIVGRVAGCDLCLDDPAVSRRHARLRVEEEGAFIEDLGSSNGTKLGGRPVQEARVEDGALLEIGSTKMRLRFEGGPELRPEAGFEDLSFAAPEASAEPPRASAPEPVSRVRAPSPAADAPVRARHVTPSLQPRPPAAKRGGLLRDDLAQGSGLARAFGFLVLVAIAVGLFLLAYNLAN